MRRNDQPDDVVSILEYFKDLKDPRSTINRHHLLGDLIVICVLAVIAGADGPKAIGMWAASNAEWLNRHLDLPHGVPSHDTIGWLLATLKPQAFQQCFHKWTAVLGEHADEEDDGKDHVAIDGKAVRRSHDRRRKSCSFSAIPRQRWPTWLQLGLESLSSPPIARRMVSEEYVIYFSSANAAHHCRRRLDTAGAGCSETEELGPWCLTWRNVIPQGFRFSAHAYATTLCEAGIKTGNWIEQSCGKNTPGTGQCAE